MGIPIHLRKLREPAFTLVELLTVIAIIAVLAALLFPAVKNTLASSKSTRCLSNLNQIRIAASCYSSDHDGSPLPSSFWFVLGTQGYLPTNSPVWDCPADVRANREAAGVTASYGYNATLLGLPPTYWNAPLIPKMVSINKPGQTLYFCDADAYYVGTPWTYHKFRHNSKMNVLFMDLHVEAVSNTNDFAALIIKK